LESTLSSFTIVAIAMWLLENIEQGNKRAMAMTEDESSFLEWEEEMLHYGTHEISNTCMGDGYFI
jgi:hypothetical protein